MSASLLPNGDEFMLLPEIAGVLRCSVKTVRRLIQDGKLSSGKNRGRVVVLKSVLQGYIDRIMGTT